MHRSLVRSFLILCLVCGGRLHAQTPQYLIGPVSDRVVLTDPDLSARIDTAGVQGGEEYILIDRQYDLGRQQTFWRQAVRLTSNEGVQNGSRFSVSYDPSYQRLTIHHLRIIRNGRIIDKLDRSTMRVLRREEDMNSYLYDGTLSVVCDISDVRPGDVVDQAITIEGWNPVDRGRFHRQVRMGFSIPVARCITRLVSPAGRAPTIAYHGNVPRPRESTVDGNTVLTWDQTSLDRIHAESGAPRWFDAFPWMEVSEFDDLEDLRSWALELYGQDHSLGAALTERIRGFRDLPTDQVRMDSAIAMVQREIRYLGLEEGIGAYRPHRPGEVYEQRFGDCKDKSLLLSSVLNALGIEAYPALVNSSAGAKVAGWLPRPSQFDHCITMVVAEGDTMWVDATATHNGGRGKLRYTPDYGKALVISPRARGYTSLVVNDSGSVSVMERLSLGELGGEGELAVRSEFSGGRADRVRADIASRSLAELGRTYADYYSGIYGPCELLETVRFEDDREKNVFTVHERYRILQPWDTTDNGAAFKFELFAAYVRDYQSDPGRVTRNAPYALGEPLDVRHTFRVELPVTWSSVDTTTTRVEGLGISFVRSVEVEDDRIVTVDHRYTSSRPHIEAEDASALHELQTRIGDALTFEFTHPLSSEGAGIGMAWGDWFFLGTCALLAVFGCIQLYRYDPPVDPEALGQLDRPIGGFLILPLIGLCFSVIRILVDMFQDEGWFFLMTGSGWAHATEHPLVAEFYTHFSQAQGVAILAYTVLLLVLFIQRRTSTPLLMKVLYLWSVVFLLVDLGLYNWLKLDEITGNPYAVKEVTRSFIAACIWIPVFHFSKRVKNTFTRPLGGPEAVPRAFPPQPAA
ncbi:MAG: DUF3857 domain-containing protein [Flavobacteriales bacterium]|nr:DUF3857 domain-containing protein [Flavobacteriales bacterium]HPF90746.1 DUF3857 domain-containing protein [Flavobacteriales bacterium]